MPSASRRLRERREREREAARAAERAEQRREEALERQRELEREEQREEERRQAALALAREFEAAESRARERAAMFRAQLRRRQQAERRRQRREERADRLRAEDAAAERAAERESDDREAARDAVRAALRSALRAAERHDRQRAEVRDAERRDQERAVARREARTAQATQARRDAARDARRTEAGEAARAGEREAQRRAADAAENQAAETRERQRAEKAQQRAEERSAAERAERRSELRRTEALSERTAARRSEERAARATSDSTTSSALGPRVPARVASGQLSGSLPWLQAPGRHVVDESGAIVTLRGITARGFERATSEHGTFAGALTDGEVDLIAGWGATCVTVPIAQDLALDGSVDGEPEDYLDALDSTIELAAARGLYTLVQLAVLSSTVPSSPDVSGDRFEPALPDTRSIDLWGELARRYQNEPAVLFDLFRSPHDPDPEDHTFDLLPRLDDRVWRNWLLAMLGEIRRSHPQAVVIARGIDRRARVSGFPLANEDGTRPSNIVYFGGLDTGRPGTIFSDLERLARTVPVGATWRAGPFDGLVVEGLGRRLARAGINWVADGWVQPGLRLAEPSGDRLAPTRLGRAFRMAMSLPPAPEVYLDDAARASTRGRV